MARIVATPPTPAPDTAKPVEGAVTTVGRKGVRVTVSDPSPAAEPTQAPAAPEATPVDTTPATPAATEPAKAPEKTTEPAPKTPAPDAASAEKIVAEKGFDMAALRAEYAETGALSEETLAAFEAKGIPRADVDAYIEGQKARSTLLRQEFDAVAGGADKLDAVMKWAGEGENLTQAQKDAYNAAIDSGNSALATLALRGILATYADKMGTEPTLVESTAPARADAGPKAYESRQQILDDMGSKKYKTDSAFREAVKARLSVTDEGVFGR